MLLFSWGGVGVLTLSKSAEQSTHSIIPVYLNPSLLFGTKVSLLSVSLLVFYLIFLRFPRLETKPSPYTPPLPHLHLNNDNEQT